MTLRVKKWFAIVLVIVLAFCGTACTRTEPAEPGSSQEPTESDTTQEPAKSDEVPENPLIEGLKATALAWVYTENWFWYETRAPYAICRVPRTAGEPETVFELNEGAIPQDAGRFFAANGCVWLAYYAGSLIQGETLFRFDEDGTYKIVASQYSGVAVGEGYVVKTDNFPPPEPNNLYVSTDNGDTWERCGDPQYLYGSFRNENGGYTSNNQSLAIRDHYVYAPAVFDPYGGSEESSRYAVIVRVNLETGETERLTDEAMSYELYDNVLVYSKPDGTSLTVSINK